MPQLSSYNYNYAAVEVDYEFRSLDIRILFLNI